MPTKKKNSITFCPGKFKLGKDSVTIFLPKTAKTIFSSKTNKLYWAQIGGTLQLICENSQPSVPVLSFDKSNFVAH